MISSCIILFMKVHYKHSAGRLSIKFAPFFCRLKRVPEWLIPGAEGHGLYCQSFPKKTSRLLLDSGVAPPPGGSFRRRVTPGLGQLFDGGHLDRLYCEGWDGP